MYAIYESQLFLVFSTYTGNRLAVITVGDLSYCLNKVDFFEEGIYKSIALSLHSGMLV